MKMEKIFFILFAVFACSFAQQAPLTPISGGDVAAANNEGQKTQIVQSSPPSTTVPVPPVSTTKNKEATKSSTQDVQGPPPSPVPVPPVPPAKNNEAPKSAPPQSISSKNIPDEVQESDIIKADTDTRKYRRFKLESGLDVLVVSDSLCTRAAASMDVGTGYWNDPEEIPGLAHFLEHMLFLGTKKYPVEDEYSDYLSKHGGESNAYTSTQNTNFFFDIEPEFLEGALDRFSQFFISPLLTSSATEREAHAVDSEHQKNLQQDNWRTFQLIQSLANSNHPYHKFGTGSAQTLFSVEKEKLNLALRDFYQKYYTANNMGLVVLGNEDLGKLEKLVRDMFKDMPRGDTTEARKYVTNDTSDKVWSENILGSLIRLESVKDSHELTMIWSLPPQTLKYKSKSVDYISYFLGNEGHGSILSILSAQGLATELVAGPDQSTTNFDLFQINIKLTKKAMDDASINYIVKLIMSYLNLLISKGIEEWRWEERGLISNINFKMKYKEASQDFVGTQASNLHKFEEKELLAADFLYREYDPEEIKSLIERLNPSKMLLLLSAKDFEPSVKLTETEKWYSTKYSIQKFGTQQLIDWTKAYTGEVLTEESIQLPEKNVFIPTSLELKSDLNNTSKYPVIVRENVQGNQSIRVWYKGDIEFKRPRANVVCKFWSLFVYSDPLSVVRSKLLVKLIKDIASENLYNANQAGYEYDFDVESDGFELKISGYDSGLKRLITEFVKYMKLKGTEATKSGMITESRFQSLKENLEEEYRDFSYSQPHSVAMYEFSLLVEEPHFDITEYQEALRKITLQDILDFSDFVYTDMSLECLFHGNLRENEALDIVNVLSNTLQFTSIATKSFKKTYQKQRIVKVEGDYTFSMTSLNPNDVNSAIYSYYQYGFGGLYEEICTKLLSMMITKPAFHQLRTVEQLGYIVWSGSQSREGVFGIKVIVQSSSKDAYYLQSRVRNFMKEFSNKMKNMTSEEYETYVTSLTVQNLQKSRTLSDQTAKFWAEVSSQQFLFERSLEQNVILKNITKDSFLNFFEKLVTQNRGEDGVADAVHVLINAVAKTETDLKKVDNGEKNSFVELSALTEKGEVRSLVVECSDDGNEDELCKCKDEPDSSDCKGWVVQSSSLVKPTMVPVGSLSTVSKNKGNACDCLCNGQPTCPCSCSKKIAGIESTNNSLIPSVSKSTCNCLNNTKDFCHRQLEEHCCCKDPELKENAAGSRKENLFTEKIVSVEKTCGNGGPPRMHEIVKLTSENRDSFKASSCLFPMLLTGNVTIRYKDVSPPAFPSNDLKKLF